jgi:hypothetical protein
MSRHMFYVHDGNPTPFNALIEAKRLAYDAAAGQPPMPRAKWMPGSNYSAMEYDGVPVSIPKLCATASILVSKARAILCDNLLFGLVNPSRYISLQARTQIDLRDDISSAHEGRAVGYSFFSDDANGFDKHRHVLLTAILSDRLTAAALYDGSLGFQGWNEGKLKTFLHHSSTFLKCFFSLMHLTYGQPARAEELSELALQNTRDGQRNIYWTYGTVMVLTRYHKSRSVNKREKYVARFLPRCVSELLLQYVILVRPLVR